jgi:hypothetical protein
MTYFEYLREGSAVHTVEILDAQTFIIRPADGSDDCRIEFQKLISKAWAEATSGVDWYFDPHPQEVCDLRGWTGVVYDFAKVRKYT